MKRNKIETALLAMGALVVACIIGGLLAVVFLLGLAVTEARDAAVENNLLIRALIMTQGYTVEQETEQPNYPTEL